jgi:prepilin-type N-terminal cleavage/methylation domain-containing protein
MPPAPDKQGFTLIEVLAAMLLLSLAYVAILESFSSSMARISKLDHHYNRLIEVEQTILSEPLFFVGAESIPEGELYLEGRRYNLISQNSNGVETLLLVHNR